jgi:hypothetical protein
MWLCQIAHVHAHEDTAAMDERIHGARVSVSTIHTRVIAEVARAPTNLTKPMLRVTISNRKAHREQPRHQLAHRHAS